MSLWGHRPRSGGVPALQPFPREITADAIMLVTAWYGQARLLDNLLLITGPSPAGSHCA